MINLLSFSKYVKFESKLGIEYKKMFRVRKDGRNDFKPLKIFENAMGIYYFVTCDGVVLYVGESHKQGLHKRIAQHFVDTGTGGLRYKLKRKNRTDLLRKLENSILYVFPIEFKPVDVQKLEKILIKLYDPVINGVIDKGKKGKS